MTRTDTHALCLVPPTGPRTRCGLGGWRVTSAPWPGLRHLGTPSTIAVGSFDEEIEGSEETGVPPEWWARKNSEITRVVDLGHGLVGVDSKDDRGSVRPVDLIRRECAATDVMAEGLPDFATGGRLYAIASVDRSAARLDLLDVSRRSSTALPWRLPAGDYGVDHFVIDAQTIGIVEWDVPMNSHAAWREHPQLATFKVVDLSRGIGDRALTLHASSALEVVATSGVVLAWADDAWDDGGVDGGAYDLAWRRLWSFPAGTRLVGEDRDRVFVSDDSGSIRALDLASGEEVGALSAQGGPTGRDAQVGFFVTDDVLVFRLRDRLVAADRTSLASLWTRSFADDAISAMAVELILTTASSILVSSRESRGVTSLDPRTCRELSSVSLAPYGTALGAPTLAAGRLVFAFNQARSAGSPSRAVAPLFPQLVVIEDAVLG